MLQFAKEIINLITGPREAAYPEELRIPCYFQLREGGQNSANRIQQLLLRGVVQIRTQKELEAPAEHQPLFTTPSKLIHVIVKADYTYTKQQHHS